MNVLVDTSIWSLALRRDADKNIEIEQELRELITEFRAIIIGPIRQEVLSGISDPKKCKDLKQKLKAFEDINITTEHYEYAAEIFNICRKKGIQGSHIDFLICSVSILNNYTIFSTDNNFKNFQQYINIKLHDYRAK